jgi:predicted MFS family arabinose efflux permease
MGLNILGSFGVAAFIGTDVFGALDRGDHDCAACIAAIKIAFEVMCGLVGKGVCAAVGAFTALVGGAACQIVVEVACAYATLALPDAKEICSGDAVVLDDPVCN